MIFFLQSKVMFFYMCNFKKSVIFFMFVSMFGASFLYILMGYFIFIIQFFF